MHIQHLKTKLYSVMLCSVNDLTGTDREGRLCLMTWGSWVEKESADNMQRLGCWDSYCCWVIRMWFIFQDTGHRHPQAWQEVSALFLVVDLCVFFSGRCWYHFLAISDQNKSINVTKQTCNTTEEFSVVVSVFWIPLYNNSKYKVVFNTHKIHINI